MKSTKSTQICKICFKQIRIVGFFILFNDKQIVCNKCLNKLVTHIEKFHTLTYSCLSIYHYDETIKSLLFQLKGCNDFELAPIFLYRFSNELHIKYHNYYLVPAPSYFKEDENRGFNHVIEIFRCLKLPYIPIIKKSRYYKQSEHNKTNRNDVADVLCIDNKYSVSGLNILIVDDVFTTGSTVSSMIKLLEPLNPKKIKVLVMSKTVLEAI